MSGGLSRAAALTMVLGLTAMALLFLVFTMEEVARDRPDMAVLGVLTMAFVYGILLRGPVGKALASMLEGRSSEESAMLSGRVAELEDRLQEISLEAQRFMEIEERLDFTERLLAQQPDAVRRNES